MMPSPATVCRICQGSVEQKFTTPGIGLGILECRNCGLQLLQQQPSLKERHALYDQHYYEGWSSSEELPDHVAQMKRQTFQRMFQAAAGYSRPGRLLDVGCAFGTALEVAQKFGWDVYGMEVNPYAVERAQAVFGSHIMAGDLAVTDLTARTYHAVLMSDVLEHLPDPLQAMTRVRACLEPEGLVIINTPCTDSLSAKLLKGRWPNFKAEHLCYFSNRSLLILFEKTGFRCRLMRPSLKALNLLYVDHIMTRYHVSGLTPCVRGVIALVPRRWRTRNFFTRTGETFVIAQKVSGDVSS